MANKKTTLKTQTGDNVYPNVLKENLPAAVVFYGDEGSAGAGNEGSGGNVISGSGVNVLSVNPENDIVNGNIKVDNINFGITSTNSDAKYSVVGIMTYDIPNLYKITYTLVPELGADDNPSGNLQVVSRAYDFEHKQTKVGNTNILLKNYSHFITLTKDSDVIYLQYQNTDSDTINTTDGLKIVIANKKLICTGILGNSDDTLATPLYVSGEGGNLNVYYVLKTGQGGGIQFKNIYDYAITDYVSPADNVRVLL